MFRAKNNVGVGLVGSLALAIFFMASVAYGANPPASIKNKMETSKGSAQPVKLGRGNPVAGKEKSELCQGCHGEDGNSPDSMTPKLA